MAGFQSHRRGRSLIKRLGLTVLALAALWLAGLVRFADSIPLSVEREFHRTDALVVLTGGSGRLDEGMRLLNEDRGERLFISGVYRGIDVRTLLTLLRQNPGELENRVGIGTATNTRGNATETAEWAAAENVRSMRLITGSYHMPRSLLEFHHAMPGADITAHPVFSERVKVEQWWAWPGTAALIAGEYSKFLLAWLRHRLENLLMTKAASK